MPDSGNEETVRIVAMDKSFHVGCYRCEVSLTCYVFTYLESQIRLFYPVTIFFNLFPRAGYFFNAFD